MRLQRIDEQQNEEEADKEFKVSHVLATYHSGVNDDFRQHQ